MPVKKKSSIPIFKAYIHHLELLVDEGLKSLQIVRDELKQFQTLLGVIDAIPSGKKKKNK